MLIFGAEDEINVLFKLASFSCQKDYKFDSQPLNQCYFVTEHVLFHLINSCLMVVFRLLGPENDLSSPGKCARAVFDISIENMLEDRPA